MSARSKGPRLWLRRERKDAIGVIRRSAWIIRDAGHDESTGCLAHDISGAEKALARYIATKHARSAAGKRNRHPAAVPIADVLNLYARDIAPNHARPRETAARLHTLDCYFGSLTLADINGQTCRDYAATRPKGAARRELEDLRAAINYHRREGLCSEIVEVALPEASAGRDRWLTRSEAAKLILAAWRYRETQLGRSTDRRSRQHIARFILVALYTGSRAGAVCGAALEPTEDRGWIDLSRGVFYRRPAGKRETKKRQPPVPLPPSLLAHLRRWRREGQRFAVEWNGKPVTSIRKAFAAAVADSELPGKVTPHVLRHTAATWLMQAGVDLWEAAGFLGMTIEMLAERYGHHHPDHLSGARRAFSKHREAVAQAVARRT
jgi:integrase